MYNVPGFLPRRDLKKIWNHNLIPRRSGPQKAGSEKPPQFQKLPTLMSQPKPPIPQESFDPGGLLQDASPGNQEDGHKKKWLNRLAHLIF
jgi:hypothetical protein